MRFSTKYSNLIRAVKSVKSEIIEIQKKIAEFYGKYRFRKKGERFKFAYDVVGKSLREAEEMLAVGMYFERKEIFVTVFSKGGFVLKVTASIGSINRCKASDNPQNWVEHIKNFECDEVRNYHNHHVKNNKTIPSSTDINTAQKLKSILGKYSHKYRSFIIYWNKIGEWRLLEYNHHGEYDLKFSFDVDSY